MPGVSDAATYKAWLDKMPGANNTLHVTGVVTIATTSEHAYVVEAIPPGINPKILILEVKKTKAPGRGDDIIMPQAVKFTKVHSSDYEAVTVRGDGPDFNVSVQITQ
jgi:hypothetical protein